MSSRIESGNREAKRRDTADHRAQDAGHGKPIPQGIPNPCNQLTHEPPTRSMDRYKVSNQPYQGPTSRVGREALSPPPPQQPPVYGKPYHKDNPTPPPVNYPQ